MYFLKDQLTKFFTEYGVKIEAVIERKTKLQKEYFVFDGEQVKHEGEDKDRKPVMLEGKTYEEFMKAYTELMNEPVSKPLVLHQA